MAMSVTYTNFCGIVIHENRGGTERDYMQDPLGSTAALLDNTQTKTDTWEYWPYGEVSARTGTNPTPLTFVGLLGYFKDILDKLFYVRARHLKPDLGRWLTVDPVWLSENAYVYCNSAPSSSNDPSGGSPVRWGPCGILMNDFIVKYCSDCYKRHDLACIFRCSRMAEEYYRCKGKRRRNANSGETWHIEHGIGVVPNGGGSIVGLIIKSPCFSSGVSANADMRSNCDKCKDDCLSKWNSRMNECFDWPPTQGGGPFIPPEDFHSWVLEEIWELLTCVALNTAGLESCLLGCPCDKQEPIYEPPWIGFY